MAQQKAQELLTGAADVPPLWGAGPHNPAGDQGLKAHQLPHRLVRLVRYPDLGQMPGAKVLRQAHRITPIVLHPISRLARDQGRRHDIAAMPQAGQQTLHAIAARPRLIAEIEPGPIRLQLLAKPPQRIRRMGNGTIIPTRLARLLEHGRYRDRLLMDIQPHKQDIVGHGSSPLRV